MIYHDENVSEFGSDVVICMPHGDPELLTIAFDTPDERRHELDTDDAIALAEALMRAADGMKSAKFLALASKIEEAIEYEGGEFADDLFDQAEKLGCEIADLKPRYIAASETISSEELLLEMAREFERRLLKLGGES